MWLELLTSIMVLFTSLAIHEAGHLFYHRRHGKYPKFRYDKVQHSIILGTPEDYAWMTNHQYVTEKMVAVVIGLFAIGIPALYFPYLWFLLIPYLIGSKSDISEIVKGLPED